MVAAVTRMDAAVGTADLEQAKAELLAAQLSAQSCLTAPTQQAQVALAAAETGAAGPAAALPSAPANTEGVLASQDTVPGSQPPTDGELDALMAELEACNDAEERRAKVKRTLQRTAPY